MTKSELRKTIRKKLASLSPGAIARRSAVIAEALFAEEAWRTSRAVFAYMSLHEEVQTGAVILEALATGKRVFLPRVSGNELVFHEITSLDDASVPHVYGMREPRPDLSCFPGGDAGADPACVIVPGLAFDRGKNRLGRGRGFYDAFLAAFRRDYPRRRFIVIGVCFGLQLLEKLPVSDNDIPVDLVLTEAERIE